MSDEAKNKARWEFLIENEVIKDPRAAAIHGFDRGFDAGHALNGWRPVEVYGLPEFRSNKEYIVSVEAFFRGNFTTAARYEADGWTALETDGYNEPILIEKEYGNVIAYREFPPPYYREKEHNTTELILCGKCELKVGYDLTFKHPVFNRICRACSQSLQIFP